MPDGRTQESHKIRDITTNKIIARNSYLIFLLLDYQGWGLAGKLFNIIGFSIKREENCH